ncbi:MAG: Rad2 nuclease [Marteilia pararefringens]
MGIKGLLPFLRDVQEPVNVKDLAAGSIVAIDAYVWLHKSAYYQADKIMFSNIPAHLQSCSRYIDLLIYSRLVPILVFDGHDLPGKKETDQARRMDRKRIKDQPINRKNLGQSLEIDHKIAHPLIQLCHAKNIHYIVAPYEADAQIAYLALNNYVDYVITEDSDLLVYGCSKVIFKLNMQDGSGVLIRKEKIYAFCNFDTHDALEKFRIMCILAGCDYVKSINGMGIKKAYKFLSNNHHCDIDSLLNRLMYGKGIELEEMRNYTRLFKIANYIFQYQIIFDPNTKEQRPLNSMPELPQSDIFDFIGVIDSNRDSATDFSSGNIDPATGAKVSDLKMLSFQSLNGSQIALDREVETFSRQFQASVIFKRQLAEREERRRQESIREAEEENIKIANLGENLANLHSPTKAGDSDGHCAEMFSHSDSEFGGFEVVPAEFLTTVDLKSEDHKLLKSTSYKSSSASSSSYSSPMTLNEDDTAQTTSDNKENNDPTGFTKVSKYFQQRRRVFSNCNLDPGLLKKARIELSLRKEKISREFRPPRFLDRFRP